MHKGIRGPLRWYGGKQRLAGRLIELIPDQDTYVEVFAGGAALLFAKEPKGLEVLNDLDSGVKNFYEVLRDDKAFERFHKDISLTPFSSEEFTYCKRTWNQCDDPVEKARRWFVVNRMCYGGIMRSGFGRTKKGRPTGASLVNSFLNTIDRLPEISERLRRVQIENRDFRKIIREYDAPEAFFYLDPPYVHDTRKSAKDYAHEMSNEDHKELVGMMLGMKGKAMLSGYQNHIYSRLEESGWTRKDYSAVCTVAPNRIKDRHRTESVWMNF